MSGKTVGRLGAIGWAATMVLAGAAAGAEPSAATGKSVPAIRDCPDVCPEMLLVPAGGFRMGSPIDEDGRDHQEGPMHRVRFANGFYVGKYDVTVGQFAAFV